MSRVTSAITPDLLFEVVEKAHGAERVRELKALLERGVLQLDGLIGTLEALVPLAERARAAGALVHAAKPSAREQKLQEVGRAFAALPNRSTYVTDKPRSIRFLIADEHRPDLRDVTVVLSMDRDRVKVEVDAGEPVGPWTFAKRDGKRLAEEIGRSWGDAASKGKIRWFLQRNGATF
ncbi:MAG: hypothetical protein IT384_15115 [Deltaproteobacteria bacterium]|nr:hypothetical protein [Deltaproteobacteria bacterium]